MTDNLVTEALSEWAARRNTERAPDGMWHPSQLWGCPRDAIYAIRGEPQSDPPDARLIRLFQVGKVLHEVVQEAVQVSTRVVRVHHEVTVFDDNGGLTAPTTGDGDDLVQFADGTWEVEEYKTKNSNMMRSDKQLAELPSEDHLGQVKTYIRAIRRNGAMTQDGVVIPVISNLTAGRIVYISKDDLKIAEYPVRYIPEVDDQIIDDRLAFLERYRQDPASLPPRLPLVLKTPRGKKAYYERDPRCLYSSYASRCWDDPDEVLPR